MNNYSLGSTRLMRSSSDRRFAGVCGGLAEYFAIDSTIVRLIFVGLIFAGVGFLVYPVMWLVMPRNPMNVQALPQTYSQQPLNAVQQPVATPVTLNANARFDPMTGKPINVEPARFDPYTGAPIANETVLPINNIGTTASAVMATPANPQAVQRRQNVLKILALGVGLLMLGSILSHASTFMVPLLLVGIGVYLLRTR